MNKMVIKKHEAVKLGNFLMEVELRNKVSRLRNKLVKKYT